MSDAPVITNIQKYSIHDGDGIRTSVFFKGCPLRCLWCHNPETQVYERQIQFDPEKCTGCGRCARACPEQAISIDPGTAKACTDTALCQFHGKCEEACVTGARAVLGRQYTVREVMKEIMKDEMFYEQSGGGVTLSGGEVMTQNMDYIEELVKKLHREMITVYIDTCGQAPYENFHRILPYVHTFLYDLKCMDPETHRKYMGVGNSLILENLKRLSEDGARIYIRIPTVPGVSGTEENMRETIAFLKNNHIHTPQINLLPDHNTGSGKYAKLGRTYGGAGLEVPSKEQMEHFAEMFRAAGYSNTKIGG